MNIFVVEDERWALAELKELLARYEPMHRVYAFDNGDDALAAAADTLPQLVLTDINMPGIDGLELIEQLCKLDSAIKCVILSVHDEFEYARQGMQFGVGDYLLKPVKKDVLYQAMDKAIAHIEQEQKRREVWFAGTLAQMLLAEEHGWLESELEREVNDRVYGMALLVMDKGQPLQSWNDANLDLTHGRGGALSHTYPKGNVQVVDLNCRQRVLLFPLAAASQATVLQPQLSLLYEQLRQLPVPAHLGFAMKAERESLRHVFFQLKQRLEEQMLFGMPTYVSSGSVSCEAELATVWDKVRVLEVHYRKGELMKGQEVLHLLVTELRHSRLTKRQLGLFIQDMLFSLKYHLLTEKNGNVSMHMLQEDLRCLNDWTGYTELYEWLKGRLLALYCGRESRELNPKGLVPVLLQHIHEHYQGGISLQQFALEHHVSLGYLSRIFKSQTGVTFSDYITGYRIRKAKELLVGGIERLQDVSQLVGYEDTKHFSTLFKKIVGETPMMYAKKHASPK